MALNPGEARELVRKAVESDTVIITYHLRDRGRERHFDTQDVIDGLKSSGLPRFDGTDVRGGETWIFKGETEGHRKIEVVVSICIDEDSGCRVVIVTAYWR